MKSINKLKTKKRQDLLAKSPFLDQTDGIIKVSGRLARADLTFGREHPALIIDNLKGDALIGYIYAKTDPQGRKISGGRRRIDRLMSTCFPCRTLRDPTVNQKMADLSQQRQYKTPAFYHCGIDVFGLFNIRHGKATRANPGVQKVWILLLSCLYSRAINLKIVDSMNTPSFKLAFNRFQAIRGECIYFRSNAGSNFMGAWNGQLKDQSKVSDNVIKDVRKD